jgi:hypothetical protein
MTFILPTSAGVSVDELALRIGDSVATPLFTVAARGPACTVCPGTAVAVVFRSESDGNMFES